MGPGSVCHNTSQARNQTTQAPQPEYRQPLETTGKQTACRS